MSRKRKGGAAEDGTASKDHNRTDERNVARLRDTHPPREHERATGHSSPDDLRADARRLVANGYHPVPIAPNSKAVKVSGWPRWCDRPPTREEIDAWPAHLFGGLGLLGGELRMGDVDVLEPKLAAVIERLARRILGDTPLRRVGLWPKRALLYRAAPGSDPRKREVQLPPLLDEDGEPVLDAKGRPRRQKVEMLGRGQQLVAFGTHPDTGKPYRWGEDGEDGPSPLDVPLADLPEIDDGKIDKFLSAVRLLAGVGPAREKGGSGRSRQPREPLTPGEIEELRADLLSALPYIANVERKDWLQVGMALKSSGLDEAEARAIWDEWSQGQDYHKYSDEVQSETWESFDADREDGVTVATIFDMAQKNGWPNPRARRERPGDPRDDFSEFMSPTQRDGEPRFKLDQHGKPIARSRENMEAAIGALGVRLSHDEFAGRTLIQSGDAPATGPRHLDDDAMIRLRWSIDERFGFRPPKDELTDLAIWLALRNRFHPVRDYLAGLTWDSVPRIGRWLSVYAGAEDTEYTRAVGALFLVAAVRRVRRPGCKFDEMPVLESPTGKDKSRAVKALCPREEWFAEDLPIGADSKIVIERTGGKWIVEHAELGGMRRAEVERVKAFLSRSVDGPARLAYGRLPVERPRQFVAMGTTNDREYLKDSTGNRRFWPVAVERFDLDRLRADRDQLWAEAAAREAAGDSIRLDPALWESAGVEQERRRVADPWESKLADMLGARDDAGRRNGKIQTEDVWALVGKSDPGHRGQHDNERLGKVMRALRFEPRRLKLDRRPRCFYVRFPAGESDPRLLAHIKLDDLDV